MCSGAILSCFTYSLLFFPVAENTVMYHLLFWIYQGGDLIKWDKAKIGYYVGIDIAEGSVMLN